MSNFKTNTKNILKKFNSEVIAPRFEEKADKNSTYTKEEIDSLLQNNGGSGGVDNAWVQTALDKKVDKTEFEEYKEHTHEDYASKGGYTPNRLIMTNGSGQIIVKNDLLPSQLNHLANVTSDIQEQLLNRSTLDHKHDYLTQEDLDALDMFSGLAKDVDYNPEISSSLNSTNVQEAIDEVAHKIVDLAHITSENKAELQEKINEANSNISRLDTDKLDKDEVGKTVAELEGGKLKLSQLPDHVHTDFVPHNHDDRYPLKEDVSNNFKQVNEKLDNHTHEEFDTFAKVDHTHAEFEDLAGSHVHPEIAELSGRISDVSNDVNDNREDISKLKIDKANVEHKHQDLIDRLDLIDIQITDHTHKELVSAISKNTSEISKLKNDKADKDHLDTHLDDLDKRYSKIDHTHDFSDINVGNLDSKYAKIDHDHDSRYTSMFSDILHEHNDVYAEKIHYHDYAPTSHHHSEYSPYTHGHVEIDELREDVDNINSTIENLATKDEVTQVVTEAKDTLNNAINSTKNELNNTINQTKKNIDEELSKKADSTHKHKYEELENIPSEFNPVAHTHSTDDIDGLLAFVKANSVGGNGGTADAINYPIIEGEVGVVDTKYSYSDVRRYGALHNNTVSDLNALTNAWASWGTAIIPSGFTLSVGDHIVMPRGVKLIGENKETSIISFIKSGAYCIKPNIDNTVSNLTITKNVTTGLGIGIEVLQNSSNLIFSNLIIKNVVRGIDVAKISGCSYDITIKDCEIYGTDKTSTSNRGLYFRRVKNVTLENVVVSGFNRGLFTLSGGEEYVTDMKINNCTFKDNVVAIDLDTRTAESSVIIKGCKFIANTEVDIDSRTNINPAVFIKDCHFTANSTSVVAINSINIEKFYLQNCIFLNYNLAIKNRSDIEFESNSCVFVNCVTEYEYPLKALIIKDLISVSYPPVESELDYVVDVRFPYGDIRRYGGTRLVDKTNLPSSTKNSLAITNAFKSMGTCIIPEGEWLLTGYCSTSVDNAVMVGSGSETTILLCKTNSAYVNINSITTTFRGFTIKGVEGVELKYGFNSSKVGTTLFKDIKIEGVSSVGIDLTNSYTEGTYIELDTVRIFNTTKKGSGVQVSGCYNFYVKNCNFKYLNKAIYHDTTNASKNYLNHTYTNNIFENCSEGIYEQGGSKNSSIVVSSNVFRYISSNAFYSARDTYNALITNNIFQNSDNTGYAIRGNYIYQITSTGNQFIGYNVGIYNTKHLSSNTYNLITIADTFVNTTTNIYDTSKMNLIGTFVSGNATLTLDEEL